MTESKKSWSVSDDRNFISLRWERELQLQALRVPSVKPRGFDQMMQFTGQQTLSRGTAQVNDSEVLEIAFDGRNVTYDQKKELKRAPNSADKPLAVMINFPHVWEAGVNVFEDVCKVIGGLCHKTLQRMRSLTLKGFGAETWLQIVMNSGVMLRRVDLSSCYPNTRFMVRWLTLHFPDLECMHLNLFPCPSEIFQEPELRVATTGRNIQLMDAEESDKLECSIALLAYHFADFSCVTHHVRFLELHFASGLSPNVHLAFFSAPSLEHLGVRRTSYIHTRERGFGWNYAALAHPILRHVQDSTDDSFSVFWSRTHRYETGCNLFIRGQEPYREPPCLLSDDNRRLAHEEELKRRGDDHWNWRQPEVAKQTDNRQNVTHILA